MPEKIDACVQSCLDDPDFKPENPEDTKEEACWSLCTWLDEEGHLDSDASSFEDLLAKAELAVSAGDSEVVQEATAQVLDTAPEDVEAQEWLYCVCPECRYTANKDADVPCGEVECEECGRDMMGSKVRGEVVAASLEQRSDSVHEPYTFRVVLPVVRAEQRIKRSDLGEETEYWLHIEASGPERDEYGDRMSESCLARFVDYAESGIAGEPLPYLDGHYQDLLAALLGEVHNPGLTEEGHFAIDVLLDTYNPHSMKLFRDVERGKRHGASIAGIVHEYSLESYELDGQDVIGRLFEDLELVEISRTTYPSWRGSFTEMVARHMKRAGAAELTELMARRSMISDALPDLQRVLEAHEWDSPFGVSDGLWNEVADLTHRYQYAVVRKHADGAFSPIQSGYPHHVPGWVVSREGLGLAVTTLVEDLAKAERPFLPAEMEHAARHLSRHVVEDLGEPVPEGLTGLVQLSDFVEVNMEPVQTDSAIADSDELLSQESVQTESVSVPVVEKAEGVVVVDEQGGVPEVAGPEVAEPVQVVEGADEETVVEVLEEVEPEPEPEPVTERSALFDRLSSGLAVTRVSALLFATQQLLAERIWQEDVPAEERVRLGGEILDEFSQMAKSMLPELVKAPRQDDLLGEFIGKVELVEGSLSRRRAEQLRGMIAQSVDGLVRMSRVLENMDLLEDPSEQVKAAVVDLRADVEESISEIRQSLQTAVVETEQTDRDRMNEVLERLSKRAEEPERSRRATAPIAAAPVEQNQGSTAKQMFWRSVQDAQRNPRRR